MYNFYFINFSCWKWMKTAKSLHIKNRFYFFAVFCQCSFWVYIMLIKQKHRKKNVVRYDISGEIKKNLGISGFRPCQSAKKGHPPNISSSSCWAKKAAFVRIRGIRGWDRFTWKLIYFRQHKLTSISITNLKRYVPPSWKFMNLCVCEFIMTFGIFKYIVYMIGLPDVDCWAFASPFLTFCVGAWKNLLHENMWKNISLAVSHFSPAKKKS